jgi:hypothetical protein
VDPPYDAVENRPYEKPNDRLGHLRSSCMSSIVLTTSRLSFNSVSISITHSRKCTIQALFQ